MSFTIEQIKDIYESELNSLDSGFERFYPRKESRELAEFFRDKICQKLIRMQDGEK